MKHYDQVDISSKKSTDMNVCNAARHGETDATTGLALDLEVRMRRDFSYTPYTKYMLSVIK